MCLRAFFEKFVVVCFDDILIFSRSLHDHVSNLLLLLDVLKTEKLYANLKKCTLCTYKLVFLGFVVNAKGIEVDEEKIKSNQEWPTPSSIGNVRSFHELASFYRRFMEDFSTIAALLIKPSNMPFVQFVLVVRMFQGFMICTNHKLFWIEPILEPMHIILCHKWGS